MSSLIFLLHSKFASAISLAFPQLQTNSQSLPIEVTQSTQDQFGHYQCNSAMKLTKLLSLPPRKIAEEINKHLDLTDGSIKKIEIAGPGFINIFLDPLFLSRNVNRVLLDTHLGIPQLKDKQRLIIDFSSPNVAKEMHVGHLRSTIIGDCLARVFEFLGYDVIRYNHIGDWGTSFGMLIAFIKNEVLEEISNNQKPNLQQLMHWYKLSKKKFDEDEGFKQTAQLEVVSLQKGNEESLKIWEMICDISRKAYQEIYDLLQVRLIERGESFYNSILKQVVDDLESKGLVEISDGAKCIFLEGYQNREGQRLPLMIQKSDGGYNYDTTDMAAIYQRIKIEKADQLIYVTDAGQATHFQMIFDAAEKAGYLDRNKVRVNHVPFGLVLGSDGKKFRTRSGETEKLIDLLTTAIQKADGILKERNPEMNESERMRIAKILGLNAIKYADLSSNRISDYTFSYDRMLRFEGNTAAFLLYSYVRILGIKRKVNIDVESLFETTHIQLNHPSEISLGLHLLRFQETLEILTQDLCPNRLTDYLYQLAEKFNIFFRDCRVEGSLEQNERLLLCEATAQVLKKGLNLLGLETLEQM